MEMMIETHLSFYDLPLPDAQIRYYPYIPLKYSNSYLFEALLQETIWEQKSIKIYGVDCPQPRFVAWYGEHSYTYSGLKWLPRPMTPLLAYLCQHVSQIAQEPFNGVLLNYYKDGSSSIGMHADDEIEFGPKPVIASFSLGEMRKLSFKHQFKKDVKYDLNLSDGSLLIMKGTTQDYYKHGIAKTKQPVGPRINLTFRNIKFPQA